LEQLVCENLLSGTSELAPGFPVPNFGDHGAYRQHVVDHLLHDTPHLFGLHPNAEIGVLAASTDQLFSAILELEPTDAEGVADDASRSQEAQVSS
jgi:dynein heavy chain, axonemal